MDNTLNQTERFHMLAVIEAKWTEQHTNGTLPTPEYCKLLDDVIVWSDAKIQAKYEVFTNGK